MNKRNDVTQGIDAGPTNDKARAKPDRREVLQWMTAAAATLTAQGALAAPAKKPLNFVYIIIDDLGWAGHRTLREQGDRHSESRSSVEPGCTFHGGLRLLSGVLALSCKRDDRSVSGRGSD